MAQLAGLDSITLNQDSTCPAPTKDKLRVYSMRFCPYAQRTLLALAAKGIPVDVVNVNLVKKPEWFLKKNPLGKVPVLEINGEKTIYESLVCNEYLDEAFPNTKQLLPKDPVARANQKILVERLSDLSSAMYAFYRKKDDEEVAQTIAAELALCDILVTDKFYAGAEPGWADYAAWPWFERMGMVKVMSDGKVGISKEKNPKLADYIDRMSARPEIKTILRSPELHLKFIQSYQGGEPDYNAGIKAA